MDFYTIRWFTDYFCDRLQCTTYGGKRSCFIANDFGVLQGAILSPFLFSLYVDELRASDSTSLFKYADDLALVSTSTAPNSVQFRRSVEKIATSIYDDALILNPTKSFNINFCLNRRLHTQLNIPSSILVGGNNLQSVSEVKYLGVLICSDLSWSLHTQQVFARIRKFSYVIRRLYSFSISLDRLQQLGYTCALPVVLYCSPLYFCGLSKKDITIIRRALLLISKSCRISYPSLVCEVVRRHFSMCSTLSQLILSDSTHPLHPFLSECLSNRPGRRNTRHVFARTAAYRNSFVPFMARFLTNPSIVKKELSELLK